MTWRARTGVVRRWVSRSLASAFQRSSLRDLRIHPLTASNAVVATPIVVLVAHNAVAGVRAGVLPSGTFLAWQEVTVIGANEAGQISIGRHGWHHPTTPPGF